MSKEIEEFYKQYSARITEIDDTPLFATGTFGEFRMLTIEEYEKLVRENKILAKALELACKEELRGVGVYEEDYGSKEKFTQLIEEYMQEANEILKNEK